MLKILQQYNLKQFSFFAKEIYVGFCHRGITDNRNMSEALYEEIVDLPNHPEKFLIDVRNVDEVNQTGIIPTAINIPVDELKIAVSLDPDEFKNTYNHEKPEKNKDIIVYCLRGGRAQRAADLLKVSGFTNVRPYLGSWTEWANRQGINS